MGLSRSAAGTLLHVDASPRDARSRSRALGREFVAAWRAAHPDGHVIVRDLTREPPPFVTAAWVEGAFAPRAEHSPAARETIARSDAYVGELLEASDLLISTPLYNFCCPAALKAWIDQVVRVDLTVRVDRDRFVGMATATRATVLVTSSGDPRPDAADPDVNFIEPYLRAILGFVGIDDVHVVYAHSQSSADAQALARSARSLEAAREQLARLASA